MTLLSLAGLAVNVSAQVKSIKSAGLSDTIVCYADTGHSDIHIGPPEAYLSQLKSASAVTADININLISSPNFFARQAADAAEEIWGSLIYSEVPINVEVRFQLLTGEETGVLARTLPTEIYRITGVAGLPTRLYRTALAEKIVGMNLNGNNPDIKITVNTGFNWYYNADGNPGSNQMDFLTILLHEMAHGFSFSGHFLVFENEGWQYYTIPGIFDHFLWANNPDKELGDWLLDTVKFPIPSTELGDELQSGPIYFNGPVTKKQTDSYPKMYVPSEYNIGSSIYHVDEIYNLGTGINSMMTYAQSRGEYIHDPGPLTTNMMYDIGWVNTRFEHDTLADRESLSAPFTVTAKILGDKGLKPGAQYLYWSNNGWQSKDSSALLGTGNPDEYAAEIEVSSLGTTVNYYLQSEDDFNRTYNLPYNAPETSYTFYVGEDTIPPFIDHIPIEFILVTNDTLEINAGILDNLGLETTEVEYKINDADQSPIVLVHDSVNTYLGYFVFSNEQLKVGDKIKYRIKAVDASVAKNITYHPDTGYHEFNVEEVPRAIDFYYNDFETSSSDFLTSGFNHDNPIGFNSFGLHSDHPYKVPNQENTFYNFMAQLRIPIRLSSDNSLMSFKEITYVEPGEDGTVFGDDEFWDFVVVEGSKDGGLSWHPFADGWDSRADTSWDNNYRNGILPGSNDSQAIPVELETRPRTIDLLADPFFHAGDTVLIRFRLHSDPYAGGWGWVIDDLSIQGITAVEEYSVLPESVSIYPVPSTGWVNLSMQMKESIDELQVVILNLTGQLMLAETFNYPQERFSTQLDLNSLPDGIYLMRLSAGYQTIVKKVILAR